MLLGKANVRSSPAQAMYIVWPTIAKGKGKKKKEEKKKSETLAPWSVL